MMSFRRGVAKATAFSWTGSGRVELACVSTRSALIYRNVCSFCAADDCRCTARLGAFGASLQYVNLAYIFLLGLVGLAIFLAVDYRRQLAFFQHLAKYRHGFA